MSNGTEVMASEVLVATAKLPDDLALSEFGVIIEALQSLISYSVVEAAKRVTDASPSEPVLKRVEYGTPFTAVIAIVGATAAAAGGVAGVVFTVTKAYEKYQQGRLNKEKRLAVRDNRLARNEARRRAAEEAKSSRQASLDQAIDPRDRSRIDEQLATREPPPPQVYMAFVSLADYGVQLSPQSN